MVAISETWRDQWLDGTSDTGAIIDDRMNSLGDGVQERLQNAGMYWPHGSSDSKSGTHYISANAYNASKWQIFGVSAAAPDATNPLFTLQSTTCSIGCATTNVNTTIFGNLSVTGTVEVSHTLTASDDLSVAGDCAVTGTITQASTEVLDTSDKRLLAVQIAFDRANIGEEEVGLIIPNGYSGTIKRIYAVRDTTASPYTVPNLQIESPVTTADWSSILSLGGITFTAGQAYAENAAPTNANFTNGCLVYLSSAISYGDEWTLGMIAEVDW